MAKQERADVQKANKRIERMWAYTDGEEESLDTLKNALENIYGHEIIGAPKVYLSEVSASDRSVVMELVNSYLENPYSTITTFKAQVSKGFKEFSENRKLTRDEVLAMDKVFRSPQWQKVRDEYHRASESVVDSVLEAVNSGVGYKQILSTVDNYLKSTDSDKSLRYDIDRLLMQME